MALFYKFILTQVKFKLNYLGNLRNYIGGYS